MSRQPLVGRKIGKHTVKPAEIDVQLTDELTESFRALQVRAVIPGVPGVSEGINYLMFSPKATCSRTGFSACSSVLWSNREKEYCKCLITCD